MTESRSLGTIGDIPVFTYVDQEMKLSGKNPERFCQLFEKKVSMCKIDKNKVEKLATNYAKLCLMVVKKETGMVKECVEGELISLSKDLSNKIEWFMEIVNRSEQKLVKQREVYEYYIREVSELKKSRESQRPEKAKEGGNKDNTGDNVTKLQCFTLLDNEMNTSRGNISRLKLLLNVKKEMVGRVNNRGLNGEGYYENLLRLKSGVEEEELRCFYEGELELLELSYEGDIGQWFKDIVKESMGEMKKQEGYLKEPDRGQVPKPPTNQRNKKEEENNDRHKQERNDTENDNPSRTGLASAQAPTGNQLLCFTLLDREIELNISNAERFNELISLKKKLLEKVESKKLTAEMYKGSLENLKEKCRNDNHKMFYEGELDLFELVHEGNIDNWFKEIIKDSKELLKGQKLRKAEPIPNRVPPSLSPETMHPTKEDRAEETRRTIVDTSEANNFRGLDELLIEYTSQPEIYKLLYEKKENLMRQFESGEMTPEKYYKIQLRLIKEGKSKQLREAAEMDIEMLKMNEGDVNAWFVEISESTGLEFESQRKLYKQMCEEEDKNRRDKSTKERQGEGSKRISTKKSMDFGFNIEEITSLRALDELLEHSVSQIKLYIALFERKMKIMEAMSNKQLDPSEYKALVEGLANRTEKLEVKEAAEGELLELIEIHKDNLQGWFAETWDNAKITFESQKPVYEKLKNSLVNMDKLDKSLSEVTCITVLISMLKTAAEHNQVEEYHRLLKKREELLRLLQSSKFTAEYYTRLNEVNIRKNTKNEFIISMTKVEESRLQKEFGENRGKWFEVLKKKLIKNPPELRKHMRNEERSVFSEEVERYTAQQRVTYFIERLSVMESFLEYHYKQHGKTIVNSYVMYYETNARKCWCQIVDKLLKNEPFDLVAYCNTNFPEITPTVFYDRSETEMTELWQEMINKLQNELNVINNYLKSFVKKSNQRNLQEMATLRNSCERQKELLEKVSWDRLQPMELSMTEIEKYSIDLNPLSVDEIEIEIEEIDGVEKEGVLRVYVMDFNNAKFEGAVSGNGKLTNLRCVAKIPEKKLEDLQKGSKETYIMVKYFSKTWFFGGYDLVCSTIIQPRGLIGSNIDTPINAMLMDDNKMAIKYTIKVQKPLRGTVTKFEHYTMIIGPTYYYNPEVKQKLQDLLVGYTNPTESELRADKKELKKEDKEKDEKMLEKDHMKKKHKR